MDRLLQTLGLPSGLRSLRFLCMRNDLAAFQCACPLMCAAELGDLVGEMYLM